MSSHRIPSRHFALALVLGVVLVGCASGPRPPSPELVQRITAATTRTDHETLAVYYDREAATARDYATAHRKMAKSYQGMVVAGKGGASMPAHCNSIVSLYESIASEYSGLAGEHRQIAATAPL